MKDQHESQGKGLPRVQMSHSRWLVGNDSDGINAEIQRIVEKEGVKKEDIVTLSEVADSKSGKSGEIKVESVRKWIAEMNLSPVGSIRLGIIRNCERLNNASANVLLKTLEEPPPRAMCILVSENESLLETIASRCQKVLIYKEKESNTFSYQHLLDKNTDLAVVFREVEQIVKLEKVSEFLAGLEEYIHKKLVAEKNVSLITVADKIIETKKNIRNNANARLAIENLILATRANQNG
ncbi:MAG TPA: hypothetical protein PK263_01795 [bacterium]|nr:hypothetical protein [bacterium]